MADRGEYAAGTVPSNSTSELSVTGIRVVNTGERLLSWRSITGKRYRLQMKLEVDAPMWLDRSDIEKSFTLGYTVVMEKKAAGGPVISS